MHATEFNPNEIDPTWDGGKLWAYVEERCYGKSGLPSKWGRGFLKWYKDDGWVEIAKARRRLKNDTVATGRRPKGGDPGGNLTPMCVKLTADEHEHVRRDMLAGGITNRSEYFRELLHERWGTPDRIRRLLNQDVLEPDMGGTNAAVALRTTMSKLAGVPPTPEADYPGMTATMYDAALAVAHSSMKEILAGTLPMVEDDVMDAGLDPYGEHAWHVYANVLPKFFRALLGLDKPPTMVVRYKPLDVVDGQRVGAVQGEVRSHRVVYPNGERDAYLRLRVVNDRSSVVVMVPAADSPVLVLGMSVYAAGTFRVVRQKVVLDARQCSVARRPGYEPFYEVADSWGISEKTMYGVVEMLRRQYGTVSPVRNCKPFADYLRMRSRPGEYQTLTVAAKHGTEEIFMRESDMRTKPEGEEGLWECVRKWNFVVYKIRRSWF